MHYKVLVLTLGSILLAHPTLAHPGRTAADGGHYCWTNCARWGEVYGQRHFHGGYSNTPWPSLDDIVWDSATFSPSGLVTYTYGDQTLTVPNSGQQYVPTLRKWQELKKAGAVAGSTTNAIIPNNEVPAIVEKIFYQVYGRKITPKESTDWKQRARSDKRTEAALKGAMQWHKLRTELN